MINKNKTKTQLFKETAQLQKRIAELENTIEDYKRMEHDLRILSFTDELTGLYNRRGFFTLAEQQLKMARRLRRGVLVLYADVDNLKAINDTFGHQEGSRAIVATSNILKSTYRDSDIIGRIGGDEFVVFPVGTTEDNVDRIMNRLEKNITIYNTKTVLGYALSISFGITKCSQNSAATLEELLHRADRSMYTHKMKKRNHLKLILQNA